MWNFVVTHFNSYAGWGLIFFYYLAALIWLFVTEKRKERRILFVYMPLVVLLLFFNPWIARLIIRFSDEEIYYRLLWILPVTVTLAYALTEIVARFKGKLRIALIAAFSVMIMIGGRLVYTDAGYSLAENEYHVPQAVADICDAIVIPGREVRAAFPAEHLVYVRQYTPLVVMPYGWDDIKNYGGASDEVLRDLMEGENTEAEELAERGKATQCHYLILGSDRKLIGDLTDHGFEKYAEIDGYVIYKNPDMDFTVP